MKKLGRPRKAHADRKENISVNLPKSLVSRIESKLSYNGSRSAWVQKAIESRLEDSGYLDNTDLDVIVLHLYDKLQRKDHRRTLKSLYIDGITPGDLQAEETVKE
ncbi:unnamed protein product [marine sediment metagenome]|uniref:Uncharacterized protein n=1 Tax=marine sediment metagenome TaxID=412755 RepID=X1IKZ2_9ZZZZ